MRNDLRANVLEELQKTDVEKVDWALVRQSIELSTGIFVFDPVELAPFRLTVNTQDPKNNATYRVAFFQRGAAIWLESVLSEYYYNTANPLQGLDTFRFITLPEGLPKEVSKGSGYTDQDYWAFESISLVKKQIALEPPEVQAQILKGLDMIALGIRYKKLDGAPQLINMKINRK